MKEREPPSRAQTVRRSIADAIRGRSLSAHEISAVVRIPERDVEAHLEHLERSLAAAGERFVIEPARCKRCEFVFKPNTSRPSRCPECKGERIAAPRFSIES